MPIQSPNKNMSWFKRITTGITTRSKDKKEIPEGLWYKCDDCKNVLPSEEHIEHLYVCDQCGKHERVGSAFYFELLFDKNKFTEFNANLSSEDPLEFTDTKTYKSRIESSQKKTGLVDAIRTAHGKLNGQPVVIACMDFKFIGGSMGSVVGEKIAKAIEVAIKKNIPFICISKSGGARMMEAGFSLMQMAKTSARLTQLADAKIPYISVITDPTTGGVTASFAMLGDINISEPNALVAFAGPRVVKDVIGKDLPEGFQRAEFVLEHGFLDYIVERKDMKNKISLSLKMMLP